MVYPKNVPVWERTLRVVLGIALIAAAIVGGFNAIVVGLLLSSAAFVIITGFAGWCPACALVGRKLKERPGDSH